MSASDDPIVIVGMARTPMGGLLGELSPLSANELGAIAVKAAMEEAGLAGDDVDQVLMGNVLMAGQGQAPGQDHCHGHGPQLWPQPWPWPWPSMAGRRLCLLPLVQFP